MTKRVRIENADATAFRVVVQLWERTRDGRPDMLVSEVRLVNPCDITEQTIHSDRYLIVAEVPL